jgi:hypothetical protein
MRIRISTVILILLLAAVSSCSGSFIDPGQLPETGSSGGGIGGGTKYTIIFNINGGSGTAPASQMAVYGDYITLPSESGFHRSGFVLYSWNTRSSGLGTNYPLDTPYTVLNDATLYANWFNISSEFNPIQLTADVWRHGSLPMYEGEAWYSFNVTAGTRYYVWWNDSYRGDGTKTADIYVSGYNSSGLSAFSGVDSGWATPQTFIADITGIAKLHVSLYSSSRGTFGIVYSTSSTRPQ